MPTTKTHRTAFHRRRLCNTTDDVVAIDGRLDSSAARCLARSVIRLLRSGLRRCTFDLSAVDAVDSAGVGALMGSIRKMEEAGGTAVIVCANPTVRRLFEISGITRLVRVVPRLADARQTSAA
jgi:anti-anti-sigma factor